MADQGASTRSQGWAVLPQIGYRRRRHPRIDVGFSNEETALVYLTFGHIF
jgi:hypothetical protein